MTRRATLAALLLVAAPLTAAAQTPTAPAPTPPAPAPAPAAAPAPPAAAPTAPTPAAPPAAGSPAIEDGATVQLEYTLSDDLGAVLDTNKGQAPLTYTQGSQQLMIALEKQLAGMHTGEAKKVVLKPEDAYGPVDPTALTEVPKESLPADALVAGTPLMARNAAGESRPVVVKEVKEKTVVIDLNHPLAGKTLVFDIKVLSIEPPKATSPAPPAKN